MSEFAQGLIDDAIDRLSDRLMEKISTEIADKSLVELLKKTIVDKMRRDSMGIWVPIIEQGQRPKEAAEILVNRRLKEMLENLVSEYVGRRK